MRITTPWDEEIRRHEPVACAQCGVPAIWHSPDEYLQHNRACVRIELGLMLGGEPDAVLALLLPDVVSPNPAD